MCCGWSQVYVVCVHLNQFSLRNRWIWFLSHSAYHHLSYNHIQRQLSNKSIWNPFKTNNETKIRFMFCFHQFECTVFFTMITTQPWTKNLLKRWNTKIVLKIFIEKYYDSFLGFIWKILFLLQNANTNKRQWSSNWKALYAVVTFFGGIGMDLNHKTQTLLLVKQMWFSESGPS